MDDMPPNSYNMRNLRGSIGTINEDTPFWAANFFDPDLPIKQLVELGDPFSPGAWASMLANQLGPQFDVIAAVQQGSDDNYFVNAPGGLSQTLNFLDKITAGRMPGVEHTPMGVARLDRGGNLAYSLLFPALSELGGFTLEQDPKRRSKLGQMPLVDEAGNEGEPDTISEELRAALILLGRGVGIQQETPGDSYGTLWKQTYEDRDASAEAKRRLGVEGQEEEPSSGISDQELRQLISGLRG
jgi:hypothetical protein